jgi:uncharacterized membrane protein (UPF0127 family)
MPVLCRLSYSSGDRPMIAKRLGRLVAVGLTLVAVGCSSTNRAAPPAASPSVLPTGTIRISTDTGVVKLEVQIAETGEARRRGLMGVRELDPDEGMAFLFEEPGQGSFWMKNTLIPLAIAFWGPDGRILEMQEMTPCTTDDCPLYSPNGPFVGAVEADRGFFAEHGVQPGDRVQLVRESESRDDDY